MTASAPNTNGMARMGRIISRHRYGGLSMGLFILGALFLAVAILLLYALAQVRSGRLSIADPTLVYNTLAGSVVIGGALILLGLWTRFRTCWMLTEQGVARRRGREVQTWRFDEIAETSRFYKQNLLLVGLAWHGPDGHWVGVNAHLSGFYGFHDAVTAATSAARCPGLLQRLQRGESLDFKEWPSGISSAMMIDFGATMNVLAPQAKPTIGLTRDTLTVSGRHIDLAAIADTGVPDTWKKPTMHLVLHDGTTALELGYQRVIDFPLLMALIEALSARGDAHA